MNRSRRFAAVGSVGAALIIIALSYGLDLWRDAAKELLSSNFEMIPYNLQIIAIHLILAVSLMALNWFINTKTPPNAFVSWIILTVGGLLTLYPFLFYVAIQNPLIAESVRWSILDILQTASIVSIACSFIAVIGAVGLLRKSND
jgi:hypothetical protein